MYNIVSVGIVRIVFPNDRARVGQLHLRWTQRTALHTLYAEGHGRGRERRETRDKRDGDRKGGKRKGDEERTLYLIHRREIPLSGLFIYSTFSIPRCHSLTYSSHLLLVV